MTPAETAGPDPEGFAGTLRIVRPAVPRSLIGDAGWQRLERRAAALPLCAADSTFGFELRLGDPCALGDLFVSVAPRTPLADHFIRQGAAEGAGRGAAGFARLLLDLQRGDSRLGRILGATGLEYDIAEIAPAAAPAPGVYFLNLHAHPSPAEAGFLTAALAAAVGRQADAAEQTAVQRIVDALPVGGALLHLGAMPDRSPRAVRLVIRIGWDDIADFLERVAWPGSMPSLLRLTSQLRPLCSRCALACDVIEGRVSPRLGVEVSQGERWECLAPSAWFALVDWLEVQGWCLASKAGGLKARTNPEPVLTASGAAILRSGVNHLKLTAHEAGVEVKAYMAFALLSI